MYIHTCGHFALWGHCAGQCARNISVVFALLIPVCPLDAHLVSSQCTKTPMKQDRGINKVTGTANHIFTIIFVHVFPLALVWEIQSMASCLRGKYSTTELYLQLFKTAFKF